LERAFLDARREFDLVSYVAWGEDRGKFVHRPVRRRPGSDRLVVRTPIVIEEPNEYGEFSLEERTGILKVHGAIDREDASRDSYVITEDHYVDYLARTNLSALPATLKAKLSESSTLFLGYSLRDWNLRAIFHRIWEERPLSSASWAIQNKTRVIDRTFWKSRGVDIVDIDLKRYVHALDAQTRALIEPEAA